MDTSKGGHKTAITYKNCKLYEASGRWKVKSQCDTITHVPEWLKDIPGVVRK